MYAMDLFIFVLLLFCYVGRFISAADAVSLLKSLCGVVEQADDKETCTRALWCVGTQALAGEVVAKQVTGFVTIVPVVGGVEDTLDCYLHICGKWPLR